MQQSAPWYLVPAIVVGFAVFFTAMWSFVCVLIATLSGWRRMAARYPLPDGLQGAALPSGFAVRVGLASYRGVLHFEAAPQGLVARVMRLFPFHPPLLLPWRAITLTRGGGFFSAGTMKVADGAEFSLNDEAFTSIERALGAASGAPTARA